MKITCLHGYFIFESEKASDASKLNGLFNAGLVKKDNYFTFKRLSEAEDYSLPGKLFLDTVSTVNFEGRPWEVMRANGIVFDFALNLSVLKEAVVRTVTLKQSRYNFLLDGLIQPGSLTTEGRILSYSCYMKEDLRFFYDWVEYE